MKNYKRNYLKFKKNDRKILSKKEYAFTLKDLPTNNYLKNHGYGARRGLINKDYKMRLDIRYRLYELQSTISKAFSILGISSDFLKTVMSGYRALF